MSRPVGDVTGLRIAHVIESDGPGGAERVLAQLSTALQASAELPALPLYLASTSCILADSPAPLVGSFMTTAVTASVSSLRAESRKKCTERAFGLPAIILFFSSAYTLMP